MEQELNGLLLMNAGATLDMSVFIKDSLEHVRSSSPDTKRCAKDLLKEKNQILTMNGAGGQYPSPHECGSNSRNVSFYQR